MLDIAPSSVYPNLYKHSRRKNRTVADALQDNKWVNDVNYNLTHELLTEYVLLSGLVTDLVDGRDESTELDHGGSQKLGTAATANVTHP